MFDSVCDGIVTALTAADINAVRKFPTDRLDTEEQTVCVSVKSARIISSGLGNYIGLCTESGEIKEMYGSKAELTVGLEIFSPTPDCDAIRSLLPVKLGDMDSLSVKSFAAGEVSFDKTSGMFRCECSAEASCCLVRKLTAHTLGDYGIEGAGT